MNHQMTGPSQKEGAIKDVLAGLGQDELAALKVVCFEGGHEGITVERCHQRVNQITGKRRKNASQIILKLAEFGLVRSGRANYRQVYFVPEELRDPLRSFFTGLLAAKVVLGEDQVTNPRQCGIDLLRDICLFLSYLRKNEVRLTQGGFIFKRHLKALLEGFTTPYEPGAPEDPVLEVHPEPLNFIYSFAEEERLTARDQGLLKVTPKVREWLTAPQAEKRRRLLAFWQDRFLSWHRDFGTALTILASLDPGVWVSLPALAEELGPMMVHLRGEIYPRMERFLFRFLFLSGMIELGDGPPAGRLSPAGRLTPAGRALLAGLPLPEEPEEESFFVQPNYEILAPRNLALPVLWELELAADLAKPDRMMIYHLSKETVYRALKEGLTAEEITAFLGERARAGLPQNVAYAIADWASAYGRLYFQDACLLRCSDEVLAAAVKASRRAGKFILGEITPRDLLVDRRDYPQLLEALVEDGHLPKPGISATNRGRRPEDDEA